MLDQKHGLTYRLSYKGAELFFIQPGISLNQVVSCRQLEGPTTNLKRT